MSTPNHKAIPANHKGENTTHPIKAIILFGVLALVSIQLKIRLELGDPALVSLLGLSGIGSFILYFQDRLKKAGLSGFELSEKVREIRELEASVKELAAAVLDVFETKSHGLMQESYDAVAAEKAVQRLKKLIA